MIAKTPPIKMTKITKATRGRPCYLSFPGCSGGGEDTVPCHSPFREDSQGWGQKSHDFLVVPGCMSCHDILDQRNRSATEETRRDHYHRALKRWLETLFREGIVR